jgi:hypothetical protein
MDKYQARINQLTLEINRVKDEHRKQRDKINATRERVLGRFVFAGIKDRPSGLQQLRMGSLTLDAFVTKAHEREALGLPARPRTQQASDESSQPDQ